MSNNNTEESQLFHTTEENLSSHGLPKLTADDLLHNFDLSEKKEKRNIMDNFLFDGNAWKTAFDYCTNPKSLDTSMIRALRVFIIQQTLQVFDSVLNTSSNSPSMCCKWRYLCTDGTLVHLNKDYIISQVQKTVMYQDNFVSQKQPEQEATQDKGDCVEAALALKEEGYNPAVLNMANANTAGGGYLSGAGAQEENLHRRSNLYQCLADPDQIYKNTRTWRYPIPDFGAIYSRMIFSTMLTLAANVVFFRDSEAKGYGFMPVPKTLGIIAAAADSHPKTVTMPNAQGKEEMKLHPQFSERAQKKMKAIFEAAKDNGHDAVVLSAFGNPPRHIAELFKQVIQQNQYNKCFKVICFAIINDHNAHKQHNQEGNFKPFQDVFGESNQNSN